MEQRNYIGQFNTAVGIAMLCVVFLHTYSLFPLNAENVSIIGVCLFILMKLLQNAIMPIFFLISGYGFRPVDMKISLKKQFNYLVKPYIYVSCITSVMFLIIHYTLFHYMPGSVAETKKQVLGFLLAECNTTEVFGYTAYRNGAVWYLIALFLSWNILQLLHKIIPKKYVTIAAFCTMILGYSGSLIKVDMPFCIWQSLIAVFFLQIGYILKTKGMIWGKISSKWMLFIPFAIFSIIIGETNFADNLWKYGLLDIISAAMLAILYVRMFTYLNLYTKQNRIVNAINIIGRYSLWIMCFHTIETISIPWYLVAEKFMDKPYIGLLSVYVAKWIIIGIQIVVFENIKRIIKNGKKRYLK